MSFYVSQAVLVSVLALAAAMPQTYRPTPQQTHYQKPPIKLISQYFNQDGKGNYEYGYEQDNGQKVSGKARSLFDLICSITFYSCGTVLLCIPSLMMNTSEELLPPTMSLA